MRPSPPAAAARVLRGTGIAIGLGIAAWLFWKNN
jgi:hypothetical protein